MNEFLKSEYYWCVCVFRKWKTFFVFCFRALENFSIYFFFCLCVREIELNSCITAMILDSRFFSCVFFFLFTEFKYLMFDNLFFCFLFFFSMFNLDLCICVCVCVWFFSLATNFCITRKKGAKKTRIIFVVVVVLLWLINSIWSFFFFYLNTDESLVKNQAKREFVSRFWRRKRSQKQKKIFIQCSSYVACLFLFFPFIHGQSMICGSHSYTHAHTRIWK